MPPSSTQLHRFQVSRSLHRWFDSSMPLEVSPAATPYLLVVMSWLGIIRNLQPVPENVRRPEAKNPSCPGAVRADLPPASL